MKNRILLIVFLAFSVMLTMRENPIKSIEEQAQIVPNYEMVSIKEIIEKDKIEEYEYKILFEQTGLSKEAIKEVIRKYGAKEVLNFQEKFFSNPQYECSAINIISSEEKLVDEINFLVPLKNGDILITKAAHTLNWRNGHAAIVVDGENGITLEAIAMGENSSFQTIEKWRTYPNFVVLRLNNEKLAEEIAEYAKNSLVDIPYDFTVGVFSDKYKDMVKGTQCAHLVWQAYEKFGIDIDSDGGLLVTPKDITNSKELEVIQCFGVDVYDVW